MVEGWEGQGRAGFRREGGMVLEGKRSLISVVRTDRR